MEVLPQEVSHLLPVEDVEEPAGSLPRHGRI